MSEKEAASELPPEQGAPPAGPPPPPADWRKLIEEWIARRFGRRGLIVLAGILALVGGWWNWDLIERRPGVPWLLSWPSRLAPARLPRADPQTLAVAVAHLENDDGGELEGLIVEALREFHGVQILQFDRRIAVSAGTAGDAQHPGHESARELLKKAGADVLIWGKVIPFGNSKIPKLYWTTARSSRFGRYVFTTDAGLPELLFWRDLTALLGLQIRTAQSDFLLQLGRYNVGELKSSIERARPVLAREADRWDAITRAQTEVAFANSLILYGLQSGEKSPLVEAVQILNRNLTVFQREPDKTPLAATTWLLGDALFQLGRARSGYRASQAGRRAF